MISHPVTKPLSISVLNKKETRTIPVMPDRQAIIYVALSVVIMAYSGLFSTVPILIFYALWLPLFNYKGYLRILPDRHTWLPILFSCFCVCSVCWAYSLGVSLRAAVQFLSMIFCTVIIGRITRVEAFLKGVVIGAAVALLISFINGRYTRDYFTGEYALTGLFGSKNQVGLFANIGLVGTLSIIFHRDCRRITKFFAYGPFLLFFVCALILSHSATAVITIILIGAIFFALKVLSTYSAQFRRRIFWFFGFSFLILVGTAAYFQLGDLVLSFFGKDSTLTGRTYLWSQGMQFGMENPVFGTGYGSFWVLGQPLAEQLWYEFGIYGRGGFHFHNVFIQTFVDLGLVGAVITVALLYQVMSKSIGLFFRDGATLVAMYCIGISVMFFIRSFAEVDYLGPYGIGAFLFYSTFPRFALPREQP